MATPTRHVAIVSLGLHVDARRIQHAGGLTSLSAECTGLAIHPECWSAVLWSQREGIYSNPDWYPGLSASAPLVNFIEQASDAGAKSHCTMPTAECGCYTVGPSAQADSGAKECFKAIQSVKKSGTITPSQFGNLTDQSQDEDFQLFFASQGQHQCKWPCTGPNQPCQSPSLGCWKSIVWSKNDGIHGHPDWYPDLSADSPLMNFMLQASENNANGCFAPSRGCHCHTVGPESTEYKKCFDAIQWVKYGGFDTYPDAYGGLGKSASYGDIQMFLAYSGDDAGCPLPCEAPKAAPASPWSDAKGCESSLDLGEVVMRDRKGFNLDDTTFWHCPSEIPRLWPNTGQGLSSLRLFKVRVQDMSYEQMMAAWSQLKSLTESGMKFLIGIPVTCNITDDDFQFELTMKFVKYIGEQSFMGFAIGNEVELLDEKESTTKECADRLHDGYARIFLDRVAEWDNRTGMKEVPVTAVLASLEKYTAYNLVQKANAAFGSRFVVTRNLYPQFSGLAQETSCSIAVEIGTKFSMENPAGWFPSQVVATRNRLVELNASKAKIWIGEIGWLAGDGPCKFGCYEGCESKDPLRAFYDRFLKWDLTAGSAEVDHAFYFALRDSVQFGVPESFGLVSKCGDRRCTLQAPPPTPEPTQAPVPTPMPTPEPTAGSDKDAAYNANAVRAFALLAAVAVALH